MATMAQAIRAYVESAGGKVTADQLERHINTEFPGQWKHATLQGHLYGCVVNSQKAYIHHPSQPKFLYKNDDGTFELYSETTHGPNKWQPDASDDEVADVGELAENSISLERDIEDHLVQHLDAIEKGLRLVGRQVGTDVGRIDILAEDPQGSRIVIEVKVGEAKDSAVGQIARYLGWYAKTEGKPPRGILVAAGFPEGVQYAAAAIPNLTLVAYQVNFSFRRVAL